ncbi:helix-turn-helix domain-containing protein [Yimella sp. RIT 621]|uniref:helix-turn-helix domain-containing protein n=1 Tax=Yimella sp. RIT 621 TaxID=2510323 RepID=UPI001F10BF48|nr:helix-turn-helix domain-containing protein [Yimella sp. RIT 621]
MSRARHSCSWASSSAFIAAPRRHTLPAAQSRSAGAGLDERHLAEAVELYSGGLTLMEVALQFGVSQQTAGRALVA